MSRGEKLWGGRFKQATDPLVERYTSSIAVDSRLARYDVMGSIAHATMLGRCRIITPSDARRLVQGLKRLLRLIDEGRFVPDRHAEDVHTQLQQMLEASLGRVARKLHTARSRNDQVSLDTRLYCRDAVTAIVTSIQDAQQALVALGRRYQDVVIPGYTHLQQAQPVLLAHHLLAYVEMLQRDAQRLQDARQRIDVLPLGAGALAGTSLPIDRRLVARLLGFPRVSANSLDAVSDRDFALELLGVLATLAMHLSRLAEDLILWNSTEFGWLVLDDAFATGSSLMPQKKNPDVLELIRGQTGLVYGQLMAFLTMMKGLPLSYNRDLQWDKCLFFETVEQSQQALAVLARLLEHSSIRRERADASLTEGLCATDVAEWLVLRGVAFADAHVIVGRLVADAEQAGKPLSRWSVAALQRYAPQFTAAALQLFDPRRSVQRKRSLGSTHPRMVAQALRRWQRQLKGR
jgi:argininosuccinate lyase